MHVCGNELYITHKPFIVCIYLFFFRYPFWNASLGMNHFYVCAHDMGTEMAQHADHILWKNAIGLVNTADASEPSFIPHKDISVPPHPGRGMVDWPLLGQGGATFDSSSRTKLAFLAGEGTRSASMSDTGI